MKASELLLSGCFVLSLLFAYLDIFDFPESNTNEHVDLAICILSARQNIHLRDAIRRSWLKDTQAKSGGKSVVAKFVVGNQDCPIHPQDRISELGCQKWSPVIPDKTSELTAFSLISSTSNTKSQVVNTIYVKVMHDLILKAVGVADIFPFDSLSGESIKVVLYDAATDEELSTVHFVQKQGGVSLNGLIYKPVQEMHLPKGYEFIIQVFPPPASKKEREKYALSDRPRGRGMEQVDRSQAKQVNSWEAEQTHYQMLYVQLLDDDDQTVLIPSNTTRFLPAASVMFSIHDLVSLQRHVGTEAERDLAWKDEVGAVVKQLQGEVESWDLLVVDVMDVYRNLPHKLLLCHDWLKNHFAPTFVMKTDDDCFVNVDAVVTSLPAVDAAVTIWWGNFRRNWAVDRHGKWREPDFSSPVYPRFACGSGYVVSGAVHTWLARNACQLRKFQGEDVSMGIWMSGLEVDYVQDDRFQCAMSCQDDMLSLPELNEGMIWWHWNNSKHCQSPCTAC